MLGFDFGLPENGDHLPVAHTGTIPLNLRTSSFVLNHVKEKIFIQLHLLPSIIS